MTNDLAIIPDMPVMELGSVLARSGYFNDAREAAQAVVKVLAGRELGFGPIASMTGFYIVKGKISMSANLMGAAVKRSGRYDYRVLHQDGQLCEIEFYERVDGKRESIGKSTFSLDDARKAGTQNLDKFPRNMLFARAMSNGVKWFCPDVTGGPVYTPEELGEIVDGETGEIVKSAKPQAAQTMMTTCNNDSPSNVQQLTEPKEDSVVTPDENAKPAKIKYQPFVSWCNEWVKDARAAKYAKEGGQANMFHILARVGKLGFAEITEANVEQVKAALACVSAA
jgi:hypothetical protein